MIAPLTLNVTAAVGVVWRMLDCCGGHNVLDNQPKRFVVVFGRGAGGDSREGSLVQMMAAG